MTTTAPRFTAIQRARSRARRKAIRHQMLLVAYGRSTRVNFELDEAGLDVASVVEEVVRRVGHDEVAIQLLSVAFENSLITDAVIERLGANGVRDRVDAARIIGALRFTETTSWLRPLLKARDHSVCDSAARALGKIGGTRAASALVAAIARRGPNRRLVCELAHGAPDLFIETALAEPQKESVRPALAIAAGLRRRRTAISPLIGLLENGNRRERVISCRALGWIGASSAVPMICHALEDRDWKVRMSAAKALGALQASSCRYELEGLLSDRNPRVRKAAQQSLARISRTTPMAVLRGA